LKAYGARRKAKGIFTFLMSAGLPVSSTQHPASDIWRHVIDKQRGIFSPGYVASTWHQASGILDQPSVTLDILAHFRHLRHFFSG